MRMPELLGCLRERGLHVHKDTVRYACQSGAVAPAGRAPGGDWLFGREHIEQLTEYLSSPRRRGRPRTVSLPVSR